MSKEIITKIKEEFSKLENIDNPHELDRSTTDILGLLTELNLNTKYEELAMTAILNITATLELEVVESIDAYEKINGRNVPESKKEECDHLIKKAATQVRWDLKPIVHAV